jgi:hypothetical protein
MGVPCKPTKQICFDCACRLARNRALPIGLILEDRCEIANDVDHAKNQPVLRPHSDVGAMSIAGYGTRRGSSGQEFMHLCGGADLGGSGIDSEDEGENDGKQDCCVCAVERVIRQSHILCWFVINLLIAE